MNIWWNDVDFAILLGLLVVGRRAAAKCKIILQTFHRLRYEDIVKPRADRCGAGFVTSWCVGMLSGIVTVATLGAAAPITGPLFVGAWSMGMGCGIAGVAISTGERAKWKRRVQAARDLAARIPQLREVFTEELDS